MRQTGSPQNENAHSVVDRWLKVYAGHYRHGQPFTPEERDAVRRALSDCEVGSLDRAFLKAFQESLEYCPTAGRVREYARILKADANRRRFPRQRFFPKAHGCNITGKFTIESVRGFLMALNQYEGTHVLCQGVMTPVCWWCGAEQEPWVNPTILKLCEQHPKETKDWNPYHKGTLMCDECNRIKWPQGFLLIEEGATQCDT